MTAPLRFYERELPLPGEMVMADVRAIRDTAIDCVLLAYAGMPAMLPTSELAIRRGQRITDVIHVGQQVPLCVLRVERGLVDLSMRNCRPEERTAAVERHARDCRVMLLMRTAAQLDPVRTEALVREVVWPLEAAGVSVSALLEETRIQLEDGAATHPALPPEVLAAVRAKVPLIPHTAEKEVTLRFGTYHDGAARLQATLRDLAAQEGIEVYVIAAPKFRIVAQDKTPARAAARLESVLATLPMPC
jgi:translation initiation factor 2 alpha subunit (eIF-2alpha)